MFLWMTRLPCFPHITLNSGFILAWNIFLTEVWLCVEDWVVWVGSGNGLLGKGSGIARETFPTGSSGCCFNSTLTLSSERIWDSKTNFTMQILSLFPSILPSQDCLILIWIVPSYSPLDIFLYFYKEGKMKLHTWDSNKNRTVSFLILKFWEIRM